MQLQFVGVTCRFRRYEIQIGRLAHHLPFKPGEARIAISKCYFSINDVIDILALVVYIYTRVLSMTQIIEGPVLFLFPSRSTSTTRYRPIVQ
eukprot:scaffold3410_cov141-Cylindrotheca_fusiformis.AAC.24